MSLFLYDSGKSTVLVFCLQLCEPHIQLLGLLICIFFFQCFPTELFLPNVPRQSPELWGYKQFIHLGGLTWCKRQNLYLLTERFPSDMLFWCFSKLFASSRRVTAFPLSFLAKSNLRSIITLNFGRENKLFLNFSGLATEPESERQVVKKCDVCCLEQNNNFPQV